MNKSLVAAAVLLPAGALALAIFERRSTPNQQHSDRAAGTTSADVAPMQLWTCGMHPQVVQDHPGTCPICHMRLTPMRGGHDHGGPSAVIIDAAVVQNMGIRTAVATRGPLVRSVRTVGTLEAPETGLHDVSPRVGGWIVKLYANQDGQHVHTGEPLFDLYSPDLAVAGAELVGAVRAASALGPGSDVSARRSAEGLVASERRKLALLDVPPDQIASIAQTLAVPAAFTFRSPSDGAVVDKAVVEGSSVQAGAKLLRIENHSSLWLDLQVYQDQMSVVTVGQPVEATVEGVPGQTFHGTVTFVHPHVDHVSRTVVARATLANADQWLRPGMYATATILTRPAEAAVQVPREAVIDTGTRQIAFVALGDGHFAPRDVRMGMTGDDGRVQILDGIAAGETVVTSGQFLLDVESRTAEAIDKLRAGRDAEPHTAAPTTQAAAPPMLTVAYCPMKKASWMQAGDTLSNPYFGTAMIDCGEVRRKVAAPPTSSPLRPVVDAYLTVERGLAADTLDPAGIASLRAAGGALVDPAQSDLRRAALDVASATDVTAARASLKALSEAVIRATDTPTTAPVPGPMGGRP